MTDILLGGAVPTEMNNDRKPPVSYLFTRQLQHVLIVTLLIPGAYYLALPALDGATWWGIADRRWFWALIFVVVLHQVAGWFVFRTQLVFALFSRLFGKYDLVAWGVLFFPLFLLRPLLTLAVGLADQGSLDTLRGLELVLGSLLLIPVVYTGWSIKQYFGMARALGGDHFRPEYRQLSLVQQGAFRYSANAMYAFAFLLFWALALLTGSRAALATALFQHAYIWIHMYCTEEPDMQVIYGEDR